MRQVQGTKTQRKRPICQCAEKMPDLLVITRMERVMVSHVVDTDVGESLEI